MLCILQHVSRMHIGQKLKHFTIHILCSNNKSRVYGSGVFLGKMLDLGFLGRYCFLFLVSVGGYNPAGIYPTSFPNLRGKANIYLT